MDFKRRLLLSAVVVVWLSVIIKYETCAFLSQISENTDQEGNHGGYRIRDKIREAYHKVADGRPSTTVDPSDRFRVRKTVKDAYHKIIPKVTKPVIIPSNQPNTEPDSSYRQPIDPNQYQSGGGGYQPPRNPNQKIPSGGGYQENYYQGYKNPANVPSTNINQLSRWKYDPNMDKLVAIAKKIQESWSIKKDKDPKFYFPYHTYKAGILNDYNYRPHDIYGTTQGETCTNNLEFEGIVFGRFICPIEGYDLSAAYCCGGKHRSRNEQFCCNLQEKLKEDPSQNSKDKGFLTIFNDDYIQITILAIVVPLILLSCIGISICIICTQKKRIYKLVSQNDNK